MILSGSAAAAASAPSSATAAICQNGGHTAPGSVGVVRNAFSSRRIGTPLSGATRKCDGVQAPRRFVICASASGGKDLYQPFRRPPSLVQDVPAGAQTVDEMWEILKERRGLWYQYASVLPALNRAGFSPSEIDEITGINGHEQNQLTVGSQVRASLIATGFDKDAIQWFDNGGAEILYELRTLNAQQRRASAEYVMKRNLDGRAARDISKSVKDYDRRKSVRGWENFSTSPGDCLALSLYRQSLDRTSESEAENFLKTALEYAETEPARKLLTILLSEGVTGEAAEAELAKAKVIVMRLSSDEIPVVVPVCEFSAKALKAAPTSSVGNSSRFRIQQFHTEWRSYASVPGWKPILDAAAPVCMSLPNSKILPKQRGVKSDSEPILLVVDKGNTSIVVDSYFLVDAEGALTLRAGPEVGIADETVLAKVLIALRPPLADDPNDGTTWDD